MKNTQALEVVVDLKLDRPETRGFRTDAENPRTKLDTFFHDWYNE